METWQTLSGGSGWALQLDGIIYRTGTAGGHMIIIENTSDFELFSLTSKGAIQGYGYQFLETGVYGPRLIRLISITNFSVHDIALVDSPAFHLIVVTCTNGEIYNLIIRGGNLGGLDGIDTSGTNLWYHDIEVTNKDECVTIKNPSTNILVENVYCNWSGGCAMGSLGTGTAISNIEYNNIYTWQSNQMYMIKSNGGDGYVKDCTFNNFIGHSNAYGLDVNEYWTDETLASGSGIALSGLTFSNWQGTVVDPKRAPIQVLCADAVPCTGLKLSNIQMWSDTNAAVHYECESAYGSGYCLKDSGSGSYTSVTTVSAAPTGYNGAKMPNDLASGFAISSSIPIPTIPTTFYPGATPISKLLNGNGAGAGGATTMATTTKDSTETTTAKTTTTSQSSGSGTCSVVYGQCGGVSWTGATCCASGSTCKSPHS
jgi:rhamnogalacturonan hydrolase